MKGSHLSRWLWPRLRVDDTARVGVMLLVLLCNVVDPPSLHACVDAADTYRGLVSASLGP